MRYDYIYVRPKAHGSRELSQPHGAINEKWRKTN